ncbi:MAG TPA: rod shape-determining protein RodA [Allosphingosinicella sp.]|uniref:rod shape-determining protein RodA n=1 Tax=Allosphingosinicella sp. TaxID=2823234 RepID=UPI002ED83667
MSTTSLVPAPIAHLPWRLIFVVIAIGMFGALALYSAAGGSLKPWALNHTIRFFAFLGMAVTMSYVRPQTYRDWAWPAYGFVFFLLIAVMLYGAIGGGARSWLEFGFIRIQPSELMKPIVILCLASFYANLPAAEIRKFSAIWPAGLIIIIPFFIILIQPDLGTSSLLLLGGIMVMFLAGLPLRLFLGAGAVLAALAPIAYSFLLPHQKERLLIFLYPEEDPLGAGYHITQSKIAIGSGGLFGKGFLEGTQSQLQYLPEQHTDFIFPAMVEEWGMFAGLFLILLFALMLRWSTKVALDTKDRFGRLTAGGLSMTIFFYFAINLLMVMGLAPVVGIPLPLFSYGGSAMLTVMICLGILMSIDRNNRRDRRRSL